MVIASLAAYQAEHKTNPEFATVGDALWWGIVTLTTVGYGDIVPITPAGRLAGVAIMFTGIAVLGVLAGSLSSLFNLQESSAPGAQASGAPADGDPPGDAGGELDLQASAGSVIQAELAALQAQLMMVEGRLGRLAERIRSGSSESH